MGLGMALLPLLLAALHAEGSPGIEFTSVPPFGSSLDLSGRVSNVTYSNYAVAVYIKVADHWWTKPGFLNPLSSIRTNGEWSCDITTGGCDDHATEIAAYLWPASSNPPQADWASVLPPELSNAAASVIASRPYGRRISFSGYDWSVKDSCDTAVGPSGNYFSDSASNVWVDGEGKLHLKIAGRSGRWYCAEVVSLRSFGYGTYRAFLDSSVDALDTNAVLGLFTWSDDSAYTHREIDVEASRWSDAGDTNNSQFVVQPWDTAGHLQRFRVPPGATNSTHCFTWASNRVDFASYEGLYAIPPASNSADAEWSFGPNGVPQAGGENIRLNLWLNGALAPAVGHDVEVVIRRFLFVPLSVPPPAWTGVALLPGGGLRLGYTGEVQLVHRVEGSTNLEGWVGLATNVFTNGDGSILPARFYRIAVPAQ